MAHKFSKGLAIAAGIGFLVFASGVDSEAFSGFLICMIGLGICMAYLSVYFTLTNGRE